MKMNKIENIINFNNIKIDGSIINSDQIENLVHYLIDSIENNINKKIICI